MYLNSKNFLVGTNKNKKKPIYVILIKNQL